MSRMLEASAQRGAKKALGAFLENHTMQPQNTPFLEGDLEMANTYSLRVEVGKDKLRRPIYKLVKGTDEQDALRNAATVLIDAGMVSVPFTALSHTPIPAPKSVQVPMPTVAPPKPTGSDTLQPIYFEAYARKWKQLYKDGKKKHTTLSQYESILNRHLYPEFGDMDIRTITIDDVQEFMNRNAHYSAKTIREIRLVLGMVLESAREDGIISLNPARSRRLSNPSKRLKKVREPLTREQARDILAHIDDLGQERDRRFLALLLCTGMRRNEVLGLRWEDIDFERGMINVRRGVTFKGNLPVIDTPKTQAGIRSIPLLAKLVPFLEPRGENGYLIGEGDEPVTQQTVKRMWQRIEKIVNVYGKTPHHFRHTFVTLAHRTGVDDKTLQTLGGYADARVMKDVYTHTQDEDLRIAAVQLGNLFE